MPRLLEAHQQAVDAEMRRRDAEAVTPEDRSEGATVFRQKSRDFRQTMKLQ